MAKRRKKTRARKRKSSPKRKRSKRRGKRRNATTAIIANPRRRRRRRAAPKRRRARRRNNPSITFMDTVIIFGKGLAGGALAGGINWGVSKAPVGGLGQGAILFGTGLIASLAVAKWVDPVVGGGIAGGTGLALVKRTTRYLALMDLGKGTKANGNNNGDVVTTGQDVPGVFNVRRRSDSGKVVTVPRSAEAHAARVFSARRDAGRVSFPGAQTMPVTSLAARSFKSDQQVDAGSSVYVQNGRRYGPIPQNWVRQVVEAGRHTYQDDAGRTIRVRGAYN